MVELVQGDLEVLHLHLSNVRRSAISAHSLLANISNAAHDKIRVWSRPVHYPQPITSIYCSCLV